MGENNFFDLTNFAQNIKDNYCKAEGRDYFEIFIGYSQIILAHKKAIDDIDCKSLKFKVEENLMNFVEIEIPRFLVDIVYSKEFAKMIDHEEVKIRATRILGVTSQHNENDITYCNPVLSIDVKSLLHNSSLGGGDQYKVEKRPSNAQKHGSQMIRKLISKVNQMLEMNKRPDFMDLIIVLV